MYTKVSILTSFFTQHADCLGYTVERRNFLPLLEMVIAKLYLSAILYILIFNFTVAYCSNLMF